MSEIPNYNKEDINKKQNPEEIKNKKIKIDNWINKLKKTSENLKKINFKERIEETFWDLEWNKFEEWSIIKFMYMNENWEKIPCSFDIDNQTIEYKWATYKIDMPKWANIDSVEFKNGEVIITWSVWWFSWKWKTSFWKLYNALGTVFKKWHVQIITKNWDNLNINKIW